MKGRILIFSAPSGAGKTTLVHHLLNKGDFNLEFSISACSRAMRNNEVNGKDYYFLSVDEFRSKIASDDFLEWEEVYKDCFYGSLKSEVERITAEGKNVVFDVDVQGGINIKKHYGDKALAVFVMPPSVEELERRLKTRSTDSDEAIKMRVDKAKHELTFANKFDVQIVNDVLENSLKEAEVVVRDFISK